MQQLDVKRWSTMPSIMETNGHGNSFRHQTHAAEAEDYYRLDDALSLLFPSTVYVQRSRTIFGHIHSLRLLILSNGARLLLKGSPSSRTALLRRERSFLETEAQFLSLLGQSANPCIPQLYHYDPHGRLLGSAYLVRQYIRGKSLSEMEGELTTQQRDGIDRHLGFLVSTIGHNAAPGFGSLQQVALGAGRSSWREVFCTLCEGVLRDAEDMFIHLPYSEIRHELNRLAPALEEVTLPRLVVVDFGRPSHVLLNEESKQLSGVVDFSSALWGDVLMAEIFASPSPAVLQGAGMPLTRTRAEKVRLVLYACYRLVSQITVQYYRNRDETSEFAARRRLTTTIAEMTRLVL
ncbi:Aminoglycoside phosphotransferase [Penicillium bovifimosum]|uniref:Aminoglycoside phosphotransferase n=1 Tax=Penicillium bovifimosum TaxID=126998 RepID=A0A9W9H0Z5_9EURO|nr:Aminoglycoside phosphotransferase [Penicillium bovifimosum]KAJ5135604.1 Aminoglycoside phosphotransferase [Penicillium bovifimosum]